MVFDPDIRQHDFRLELDCHEIVRTYDPEFIVVKKLVETMLLTPGSLTFTPCNGWKVNMLRYKRQSTFLLEDTFMITISDVKECFVNWESYSRRNEGDQLTVNLEDFENRHWELEVYSQEMLGTKLYNSNTSSPIFLMCWSMLRLHILVHN